MNLFVRRALSPEKPHQVRHSKGGFPLGGRAGANRKIPSTVSNGGQI